MTKTFAGQTPLQQSERVADNRQPAIAARESNWSMKKPAQSKKPFFLDALGPEADLGRIIREVLPLAEGVGGAIQKLEYVVVKKMWGVREAEIHNLGKRNITAEVEAVEKNRILVEIGLHTRAGHISGIKRCMEEKGPALTDIVLSNSGDIPDRDLALQVATLLEAASGNESLTSQIKNKVVESAYWDEHVKGSVDGLSIVNLDNSWADIFPGALRIELPISGFDTSLQLVTSLLNLEQKWIDRTTYERAVHAISDFELAREMDRETFQIEEIKLVN